MEYIKLYSNDFTCYETIDTANSSHSFITVIENNLNINNLSNTTDELRCIDEELNRLKNIDENMNDVELINVENIKTELLRAMILQLQNEVVNLKEDIIFMRNEMTHKNKIISIFAGQGIRSIPEKPVYSENESSILLHEFMNYEKSDLEDIIENNDANDNIIRSTPESHSRSTSTLRSTSTSTASESERNEVFNTESVASSNYLSSHSSICERAPWEQFSTGFATKMLNKMGFRGNGLGKAEDGITEPVTIQPIAINKSKLLYIASSSMMNQMDEKRLSRHNMDVKVRCHGGCTVKCMYTHLPEMFDLKPDYILLHIGSNDCTHKTSDEVLREMRKLIEYIEKTLPLSKIIVSLPIIRADSNRANTIQKILKYKLKRSFYPSLDHSNVGLSYLGKKGLHLNNQGTKLVARNIISLIKRL